MDSSKVNACAPRSVRVRLAKPEDAEGIARLVNSAFRRVEKFFIDQDRIDVDSVLVFIETGKFFLAESEGTLRGSVYIEPRPLPVTQESPDSTDRMPDSPVKENSDLTDTIPASPSEIRNTEISRAYLGLLAVDPDHQQSGVGSMLMDAAEDYCRGLGVSFMDLKVVNLRTELLGYYCRRGYMETGTSPFPEEVKTKLPCHLIDMSKALASLSTDQRPTGFH